MSWGATWAMTVAWLRHSPPAEFLRRLALNPKPGAEDEPVVPDWTVYRAYAFSDGSFREVPAAELGGDPVAFARARPELAKVEVRYVARGRKFRVVLRPGDPAGVRWPPYAAARAACRLPRGVLNATLGGGAESVDVTARVQKYQGPHADFYAGLGLRVRVRDLFPFDDHEENALRFPALTVVDSAARHTRFDYAADDAL